MSSAARKAVSWMPAFEVPQFQHTSNESSIRSWHFWHSHITNSQRSDKPRCFHPKRGERYCKPGCSAVNARQFNPQSRRVKNDGESGSEGSYFDCLFGTSS